MFKFGVFWFNSMKLQDVRELDWHLVNEYTANDDGQIPKKEDEGNYDKNAESYNMSLKKNFCKMYFYNLIFNKKYEPTSRLSDLAASIVVTV